MQRSFAPSWLSFVLALLPALSGCERNEPLTAASCEKAIVTAKLERPATGGLTFELPSEATVRVDGEAPSGDAPPELMLMPLGEHRVEVLARGYEGWNSVLELEAGKLTVVAPELEETGQRKAAYALIGTAAASTALSIVLGVLSVVRYRESRDIAQTADFSDQATQTEYAALVSASEDFRLGSGVAGGVGLGLFAVGASLFVFDQPQSKDAQATAGQLTLRAAF